MQSEEFDSKARDAAERHHPAYDEKAWSRMEKLLNKHLPQEKDGKRRIAVVVVLLLLFLGAGGILVVTKPWKNGKLTTNESIVPGPADSQQSRGDTKASPPSVNKLDETTTLSEPVQRTETSPTNGPKPVIPDMSFVAKNKNRKSNQELLFTQDIVLNKKDPHQTDKNRRTQKEMVNDQNSTIISDNSDQPLTHADRPNVQSKEQPTFPGNDKPAVFTNDPATVSKTQEPAAEPKSETVASAPPVSNEPVSKKKTKAAQKPQSRFFLTLSGGPDVSSTGLENFGRMLLTYGAGVGYRIGDKFTLRSGLYSSRKIYSATPYDYHPPDNFWQFYTSLRRVNGDCRVLEIPLSLSYNISSNERHTWFASLGMSSYIMKRESYDYIYKNSWGTMSSWKTTIRNKNEHYFSVLGLSAGYQKRINNTLSFMAEPYVKIPMTGVGYGKVKLTSVGILFSVGIHAPKSKKAITSRKP